MDQVADHSPFLSTQPSIGTLAFQFPFGLCVVVSSARSTVQHVSQSPALGSADLPKVPRKATSSD